MFGQDMFKRVVNKCKLETSPSSSIWKHSKFRAVVNIWLDALRQRNMKPEQLAKSAR